MIGKLIMFVTVLAAGFLVGSYIMGTPLLTFSDLQELWINATSYIQQNLIAFVGTIGSLVGGFSLLIRSILTRKNETINTLNQTSTQKDDVINYLQTELEKKGNVEQNVNAFTDQYGKTAFEKVQNLSTELQVTKTTLDEKLLEIKDWETKQEMWDTTRHRLEEDTRALNSKIKKLQYDLDVATGKIQLPIK